jgi:hypothetical protein
MDLGEARRESAIGAGVGRYDAERELTSARSTLIGAVRPRARTGAKGAAP